MPISEELLAERKEEGRKLALAMVEVAAKNGEFSHLAVFYAALWLLTTISEKEVTVEDLQHVVVPLLSMNGPHLELVRQ